MTTPAPLPVPVIPPAGSKPAPNPSPLLPSTPGIPPAAPAATGANPSDKPKINPNGPVNTTLTYKDLIPVYDQTTRSWTTTYLDPATNAEKWAAIVDDPNSATGYSVSTDQAATRTLTMQNLIKQYGGLQQAKQVLADKGFYTAAGVSAKEAQVSVKNDIQDNAFNKVLDVSIGALSRTNLQNLTFGDGNVTGVATYVSGRPNYAGIKDVATVSQTSKDSAWNDIDAFMRKTAGRGATLTEYQNYYNDLHSYELTHPIRATVTRDALGTETNRVQTEGPSAEDKQAILVASAYKSLEALGKDPSAISKVGGSVAIAIQKLNEAASQYGVSDIYTPSKAFSSALDSILPGGTVDAELQKITELAKATPKYKSYVPLFNAGFSLQDIVTPGIKIANTLLGTNTPRQASDPLMQTYLFGGANGGQMTDDELTKYIKSDPVLGAQWAKTPNAREEAAGYVNQLGKMMGFIA
jgi:hypothetical protein